MLSFLNHKCDQLLENLLVPSTHKKTHKIDILVKQPDISVRRDTLNYQNNTFDWLVGLSYKVAYSNYFTCV